MPITLLDAATTDESTPKQAIILSLVEAMWVLGEKLPFREASLAGALFSRYTDLGALTWRKIGQAGVGVQVRSEQFRENMRMIRETIDIDDAIRRDPSLGPPQARNQIEGTTRKIGYGINDSAMNGSPAVNPEELIGIDYLLRNDTLFHGGLTTGNDRGQVIDAAG